MKTDTKQKQLPSPEEAIAFVNSEIPNTKSLWGEGILDRSSRVCISGPNKTGKTFLGLGLAISLTSGQSFLGFNVPAKKNVLYLNMEINKQNLQKRLRIMFNHRRPEEGRFHLWTPGWFKITNEEHETFLRNLLQENSYDVVILDPLYKIHDSDENSSKDMSEISTIFDKIIDDFDVSVVFVHHHGKAKVKGTRAVRGSTTIIDWVDSSLTITESKKGLNLEFVLRNNESPESILISKNDNLWFEEATVHHKLMVKDIVSMFCDTEKKEMTQQEIIRACKKLKGASDATVRRVLKQAKEEGKLVKKNLSGQVVWSRPE